MGNCHKIGIKIAIGIGIECHADDRSSIPIPIAI